MLAAGNVHPKLAQRLARHSNINLTMSRYSHTLLADEARALDALPDFPSVFDATTGKPEVLQATGPMEQATHRRVSYRRSPLPSSLWCILTHQKTAPNWKAMLPPMLRKSPVFLKKTVNSGLLQAERTGFEPMVRVTPDTGLANRRIRPLCHLS